MKLDLELERNMISIRIFIFFIGLSQIIYLRIIWLLSNLSQQSFLDLSPSIEFSFEWSNL